MVTVIDLEPAYEETYLCCLKDWARDPEVMAHRARWCRQMATKGLRVKLALDNAGLATGMIQMVPAEQSQIEGEQLAFVQCIWVHGYEEGIGNRQGQGYGRALLIAAEASARGAGQQGIAAWGMDFPHWLPVSWYEHYGYVRADQDGPAVLVWKPFTAEARPPRWIRQRKAPTLIAGKVVVSVFVNGWCPAGPENARIARAAVSTLGDDVLLREIDTSDRATFLAWGIDQGIWIDDAPFRPNGPPFDAETLRHAICEQTTHWRDIENDEQT